MYEFLPPLLVIVIAIGAIQLARIHERLRITEARLVALMRHLRIEIDVLAEPSDRVKELARDPKFKIEAIKTYRLQTGVGLKEAKDVIESLSEHNRNGV